GIENDRRRRLQSTLTIAEVSVFFFSSRRRHTRYIGDWSSDVCSSDLHVGTDDHAFQQRVGITLDLVAVHIGAGIAFIGIANDVFSIGLGLGHELPLVAGQVARATASAQFGSLDLLDDGLRPAVDEHLVQGLVSADRDVFLNVIGIDEAAIPQNDLLLAFEERHFVPQRNFGIGMPVLYGRRN